EPNTEDLRELVADVQKNLKLISDVDLKFSVDEASGRVKIVVREESSGKLIRQIPTEEVLDLAARFNEMAGLIMDTKG
ncbi:MAG: flagellar protein FlaG, partial [Pseudomonadota bacterium]